MATISPVPPFKVKVNDVAKAKAAGARGTIDADGTVWPSKSEDGSSYSEAHAFLESLVASGVEGFIEDADGTRFLLWQVPV